MSLGLGGDTPKRNQDQLVGGDTVDRRVDKVAEAIWLAHPDYYSGDDLDFNESKFAPLFRALAEAAIEALGLWQEWEIRTEGACFGRHITLADAAQELKERKAIEAVVPHPTAWDRNPEIVTRWVSSWEVQP